MPRENLYDKLRSECHENAFHSFGYAYIFDKRAQRFGRWVNLLKAFGVLVPAIVGATAIGYGYNNALLKYAIVIAIPITIIQFVFSLLAIVYKWDDELAYAYEASSSYNDLYNKFSKTGKFPPAEYDHLSKEFDYITIEQTFRGQQDGKHNIREWELRKGMKYALRQYKQKCSGCGDIPLSMTSTNCYVCGKFSFKNRILNL